MQALFFPSQLAKISFFLFFFDSVCSCMLLSIATVHVCSCMPKNVFDLCLYLGSRLCIAQFMWLEPIVDLVFFLLKRLSRTMQSDRLISELN